MKIYRLIALFLSVLCVQSPLLSSPVKPTPKPSTQQYELLVFGATPAGIMASIAAARLGDKVILVEPSYIVGGMMSGGLFKTDVGNRSTVGGLSFEFFANVKKYYSEKYGPDSPQLKASNSGLFFEPHVADLVFSQMLSDAGVTVLRKQQIQSATVSNNRIASITARHYETGISTAFTALNFIDSTYEGDLMAAAGVLYRVGREARCEYNEPLAGITNGPPEYNGKSDHRTQAYNIRSTITNRPDILVPFPKPKYYNPEPHRFFIDYVNKHNIHTFEELFHDAPLWAPINGKSDPNKADLTTVNYNYPEADYETRKYITQRITDHWLSLWYMLQHHPDLPEDFKKSCQKWGLPADEYTESGNITPQIYVREARRLLGRHMLRQSDLDRDRYKPDTICMGSYNIDSHDVAQFLDNTGNLTNDGYIISSVDPYEIPYRSITPHNPSNLLVTCAVSATHIAYGSLRMEPVFMMIGQAAGAATHLAKTGNSTVQSIDTQQLQQYLTTTAKIPLAAPFRPLADIIAPDTGKIGEPIQLSAKPVYQKSALNYYWNFDTTGATQATTQNATFTPTQNKTYTISLRVIDADKRSSLIATKQITIGDNSGIQDISILAKDATLQGRWDRGSANSEENRGRINLHDLNSGTSTASDLAAKTATFTTTVPMPGLYQIAFAFQDGSLRATNTPVTIEHAGGTSILTINQKIRGTKFAQLPLGTYRFIPDKPAIITISNKNANGYVSIDEIRLIYQSP